KYADCLAYAFDGVHPCAEDHRLAKGSNMLEKGIVVALSRSDLECRHIHFHEPVSSGSRKWCTYEDHSFGFYVLLKRNFFVLIQGAAFHDLVDAFVGIAGFDFFSFRRHLILDNMGLVLDDFHASAGGGIHHLKRCLKAAIVIDANLGNHKRFKIAPDLSTSNFNKRIVTGG